MRLIPFAVCLSISLTGGTDFARGQSLNDALEAAYLNNPTLMAERAALRATDEQVPQALSDWRPSMDLTGDAGSSAIKNNTSSGTEKSQHRDPRSLSLSLSQSLYSGGQTMAAISEAENTVMAKRYNLEGTEQTVLLDAVTAYMNLFRDQEVLDLNIRPAAKVHIL